MRPFRKLTQNAPFWSPPRPPSLHLCWLRTFKEIHSHNRKLHKCFTNISTFNISVFVQNSEWCQIFFPPLSRVFSSGNGCCWLFVEEKQKTIAFGNNIIAFVTSTMREKVMGRQNVFCSKHIDCFYASIYEKGRLIFFLQNFLTTAKLIRKGLVDKGKKKNIFPREENPKCR